VHILSSWWSMSDSSEGPSALNPCGVVCLAAGIAELRTSMLNNAIRIGDQVNVGGSQSWWS
jgi:hypothetical protein